MRNRIFLLKSILELEIIWLFFLIEDFLLARTAAAMGERQILPRQTNKTDSLTAVVAILDSLFVQITLN